MPPPPTVPARRHRLRRTWPQRAVLSINIVVIVACIAGAGALNWSRDKVVSVKRVRIGSTQTLDPVTPVTTDASGAGVVDTGGAIPAENWLITGSDGRTKDNCGIKNPQFAGAFGDDNIGERSDTIMLVRIDPDAGFVGILSFPRDLWVKTEGNGFSQRINGIFSADDPEPLIKTIQGNFGVKINYYANINFCGFKSLIDTIGGVKIPFQYAVRDFNTGLLIDKPGCSSFDGELALAYVRSRHYQAKINGSWVEDGRSDWNRIRRQQDLMKRVAEKLSSEGVGTDPRKIPGLVNAMLKTITVNDGVSVDHLIKLATRLRRIDPATVQTYTLDGTGFLTPDGASVIMPAKTDQNDNVLKIFKGEALPAEAKTSDQLSEDPNAGGTVAETTTSTTTATTIKGKTTTTRKGATTTTDPNVPTTIETVQIVDAAAENAKDFVPPPGVQCN